MKHFRLLLLAVSLAFVFDAAPAEAGRGLLNRALQDVGHNPTKWATKWCGRQMVMWVGYGSNKASAWKHIGADGAPVAGNIAVMAHHLGVIVRCNRTHCVLVSGNNSTRCKSRSASKRCVGVSTYSRSRFIAIKSVGRSTRGKSRTGFGFGRRKR